MISLFDYRIEFVNIGGLVKGMSLADIQLGVSVLRNKNLANVFYRLHLVEAYGTGLLKIHECYADEMVKPKIEVTDNAFKITLPNVNFVPAKSMLPSMQLAGKPETDKKQQERVNVILDLAQKHSRITRNMIENALQVSTSTALLLIKKMVTLGLLAKDGSGRNLSYHLVR